MADEIETLKFKVKVLEHHIKLLNRHYGVKMWVNLLFATCITMQFFVEYWVMWEKFPICYYFYLRLRSIMNKIWYDVINDQIIQEKRKKKSYFNKRFFKLNLLVLFSQKWIIWKAFMDWPYFQIYIYKNYETTHTQKKRKIAIDSMLNFNYFSFTNFYEFIYFYFLSK